MWAGQGRRRQALGAARGLAAFSTLAHRDVRPRNVLLRSRTVPSPSSSGLGRSKGAYIGVLYNINL
jgi:hypothetical protein